VRETPFTVSQHKTTRHTTEHTTHNTQNRNKLNKDKNMNDYSSTTFTMEETIETVAAMCHQEYTGYLAKDWLRLGQSESSSGHRLHWDEEDEAVDIECRDKMVAWCIRVIDFCEYSRATVEITMSYLDRFLATPEGTTARNDRSSYQLACMTALYVAVKIHEPKVIPPELVATFSNGACTSRDIEAMEITLLRALKWRVHPPTSWDFVHKLMSLIPLDLLTKDLRQNTVDLALLQTELAVADYECVTLRASIIAYSAIVNSLESFGLDDSSLSEVGYILVQSLCIDCNGDNVLSVQSLMCQLAARQRPADVNYECVAPRVANQSLPKVTIPRTSVDISPRTVSHV
jgi:hypothetical protein